MNDNEQKWAYQTSGALKSAAHNLCLIPNGASLKLEQCSSPNKWECNANSRSRPGIKKKSENKCMRLLDNNTVTLEDCNHNQYGQALVVYGTNLMICIMGDSEYMTFYFSIFSRNTPSHMIIPFVCLWPPLGCK